MSQTKAQLISDLVQALNFTGTASAPANGLFLSATNTLQLSTASTPRLTINSDGHVDVVGNLDVGAGIDVTGNITATGTITSNDITIQDQQPRLNFVDNAGSPNDPDYLFQVDGGQFVLHDSTNSVNKFVVNSDGHIDFIPNVDFSAGIDVTGNSTINGDLTLTDSQPRLNFVDNAGGTNDPDYLFQVDGGQFVLHDSTNSVNKFTVEANGVVTIPPNCDFGAGIDVTGAITGTTSLIGATTYGGGGAAPALYVSNTGGRQVKIHNPNAGTSSLQITNATTGQGEDAGTQLFTQATTGDFHTVNKFVSGDIAFTTTVSGPASGERLRITADGDLTFGTQSGGGSPTNSSQIRHFNLGRDHWSGTAGDYRALRLKVYHVSNDDVYGIGISSNLLEIQSQQNIGFFAGSAGGGTGRRIERARIDATNGRLQLSSTTLRIDNAIVPESHAQLNIGSTGSSETRAIDIDGNWGNGEHKSITFTHGTSTSDIVGQINCVHNSPDSSLRFGKLYHGGNSTAYTMTLDSTSTSGANLTLHDGNLIFASGHGIDFSATSDASGAASELLDDYEEGTFTPVVSAGTTNTQTFDQTGRYTKIGRMVYVQFLLQYSGAGNNAHMQFSGLPFTSANNTSRGGGTVLWTNIPGLNDAEALSAIVEQNATTLLLYRGMDSSATTGSGGFTNKAMYIRVTYEAT